MRADKFGLKPSTPHVCSNNSRQPIRAGSNAFRAVIIEELWPTDPGRRAQVNSDIREYDAGHLRKRTEKRLFPKTTNENSFIIYILNEFNFGCKSCPSRVRQKKTLSDTQKLLSARGKRHNTRFRFVLETDELK